jgi:hypothetical protein
MEKFDAHGLLLDTIGKYSLFTLFESKMLRIQLLFIVLSSPQNHFWSCYNFELFPFKTSMENII